MKHKGGTLMHEVVINNVVFPNGSTGIIKLIF